MVSSTPRPHFTPGKDPVSILQEARWAPGPVWTGGKSRPHRDSIPDRPSPSQSLYQLSYPAHINVYMSHFETCATQSSLWDEVGGLGREFIACRFFNFTMWAPNITFPGGSGQLDLIRCMVGWLTIPQ